LGLAQRLVVVTITVEAAFEQELEIFRKEEETAQQHFFAYLSVRELAASDVEVLRAMNTTPLFWLTTHHAMLVSAFIALGRIFDQNSAHNIDSLMALAFSKRPNPPSEQDVPLRSSRNGEFLTASVISWPE
jgi:hypothetical protein